MTFYEFCFFDDTHTNKLKEEKEKKVIFEITFSKEEIKD